MAQVKKNNLIINSSSKNLITDVDELKTEYRRLVCGSSKEETQEYWVWYTQKLWNLNFDPSIFRELQIAPRHNGLKNVYSYMDNSLYTDPIFTLKQLYTALREESFDLYIKSLVDNEVVNIVFDKVYEDMADKAAFEALYAFDRLKDSNVIDGEGKKLACTAASTIWWGFVDNIHKQYNLPRVVDIQRVLETQSIEEQKVKRSNKFTAYELTTEEIVLIKSLLGMSRTMINM